MVGLVGVALGWRWADPVAGAAVTLFIGHVGIEITAQVVRRLMDGVEPEDLARAQAAALSIEGVHGAHVRGRWMGRSLTLEIQGQLDGDPPISVAQEVGILVERAVRHAVPAVRTIQWLVARHEL